MRARAARISGARWGSSLQQMVEELLSRGSSPVHLQNAACSQQGGHCVLAALHLRIQAQCPFQRSLCRSAINSQTSRRNRRRIFPSSVVR